MKACFPRPTGFAAAILLFAAGFSLWAQQRAPDIITPSPRPPINPAPPVDRPGRLDGALSMPLSAELTPRAVLKAMERVADWQLAHPVTNRPTGWICAVGDVGMMALAGISGDPTYRDAMLAQGETNGWTLPQYQGRKYHADDQCIGQVWSELYFLYRDPKMIAPMRERFDWILANPSRTTSLDFSQRDHGQELWSWCDALFMAPPAWTRLYAATGDERYLNFAVTNWWRTTDYLYDTNAHLFFRDSTFFNKTETNGAKIFWSRGNGWVLAGTVRMLQYLPMDYPGRARFEQLFKDMAEKILSLQQPDGMWRASLLDPADYPMPEASGSALFTYGLAWGVNQGLLDRAKFEPAVRKAWPALVGCVDADGKLTHIQPAGDRPVRFNVNSTQPYGGGVFLFAGSEVYRMAVLERINPIKVKVKNPAAFNRESETVRLTSGGDFGKSVLFNLLSKGNVSVMDGISSRLVDTQSYDSGSNKFPDTILFQVDLAPHETRTFYILDASALAAVPPPIVKTFARYVPERHDDFAWESDRIAHRVFGKALETWQEEPLTSSGYDVWIKRTRSLVVNDMYRTMDLFNANGPAQDDFKVGKTRGDGGLGIWKDGKLYVSGNWRNWKLITTGPVRSEFELTYDAWDAGGRKISETKRISIDAGSNMSRVESTLSSDDKSPVQVGVGLGERPGENVIVPEGSAAVDSWQTSAEKGLFVQNKDEGWMTYWQPQDFNKGVTATAIILPKGSVELFTTDITNLPPETTAAPTKTMTEGQPALRNQLAIARAEIGKPFVYYIGAGWDRSGDFPNAKAWNDYIRRFAERRDQPLQVTVGN